MSNWSKVIDAINGAKSIAIFPHRSADGDALGSTFALAIELKRLGKLVAVFLEEEVQEKLSFIPLEGIPTIVYGENVELKKYDLSIAVDSGDINRLGSRAEVFKRAPVTVKIDHHISTDDFAELNYVNTKWAATCVAIWELLTELVGEVSDEAALRIYTGIYTDTGCFKFSNTDSKAHLIAAKILSKLGDLSHISRIFQEKSRSMLRLYNVALAKIEYFCDDKIAYLYLTNEDFEKSGATIEDSEGLSGYLRDIEGVDTSIFVKPGNNEGELKASLRSYDLVDVASVAASFNGGGHKRAAGFTYVGDEESMKKALLERLVSIVNDS